MWFRSCHLIALSCAVAIFCGVNAGASEETTKPADEPSVSPFDARIGWLDGACLVIKNPALTPGTPVTFMIFDPNSTEFVAYGTFTYRVGGTIVGKTRSPKRCHALDAGYEAFNDSPDTSFYEVSLEGIRDLVLTQGVGILGLEAGDAGVIDLNRDGAPDNFTLCHTGEGFLFEMWAGEARKSERLWSGNFHLGQQVSSSNCESGENFVPELGPFDLQVGYVDKCLAIRNGTLKPGTPVTIMTFAADETLVAQRILSRRVTGKILGKVTSDEKCPPMREDRKDVNPEDVSFYAIALDDGPFMNPQDPIFGIGIVGMGPESAGPIDLDGNGTPDSFTACKFHEGFDFVVWRGAAYQGEPLWRAYYYLGYETDEIECPVSEPENEPDLSGPPSKWDPVFRIGWLDGCLGISNTQLQPGTPIGIMMFAPEDQQKTGRTVFKKRVSGVILGKTESAENCPALAEDVRDWNDGSGVGFYKVALENGQSLAPDALGVGVVRPEPEEDPFDLDGNGVADGFSVCNGRNGLTFLAWIGEVPGSDVPSDDALASQLIWSGFFELGHKLGGVPNCPAGY
jgi:hypothetical protein